MFIKARIVLGIFVVVGMLMMVAGGFWGVKAKFQEQSGIVTSGKILDLNISRSDNATTWCPIVRFDADGEERIFVSSFCSSSYANATGDDIEVIYQPGHPDTATIYSFAGMYGGAMVLLGMGGVFALAGGIPLVIMFMRGRSGKRLLREGMPVRATITGVSQNTMISLNGRCPYRIEAQIHDTTNNSIQICFSENLMFNPEPYIQQDSVTVYRDKKNPERYYMDISFLPSIK